MTHRARKRLALVVLLVALPLYIAAALWLVSLLGSRPPLLLELGIYLGLGAAWALPLRRLFLGVGKPDPDKPDR